MSQGREGGTFPKVVMVTMESQMNSGYTKRIENQAMVTDWM